MKVCVLQTVLDPFKGGNHLPLFRALSDTSFTIICNRSKVPKNELPPNVEVVTVPGRIGSYYYGCSDFRFAQLLMQKYSVHSKFWDQFDVIHINQVMGPVLRSLSATGIPTVFLIHHPVTADLEVAVVESSFLVGLRWRLKYFMLILWQKKMCTSVDRVVTVSQTMKKRIATDYHCDESKIFVIPNGVDEKVFLFLPSQQCTVDVIAVGSFVHPRKGFRYLLEVYEKLAQSGISIADVGRRTEKQIQDLQTIKGVKIYGTVDEEKLLTLLHSSRVLVSTSLFEGFGLSLIEALACGIPGFAFAVGAVPEILEPVDPMLVVPTRDTSALVVKIDEFLSLSAKERKNRGAEYRRKVLELYSLQTSAEALKKLYSDCAQG